MLRYATPLRRIVIAMAVDADPYSRPRYSDGVGKRCGKRAAYRNLNYVVPVGAAFEEKACILHPEA